MDPSTALTARLRFAFTFLCILVTVKTVITGIRCQQAAVPAMSGVQVARTAEGNKCIKRCNDIFGACANRCCYSQHQVCLPSEGVCLCGPPQCQISCKQTTGPCKNQCCTNAKAKCVQSGLQGCLCKV